jgi:hypothetical protein
MMLVARDQQEVLRIAVWERHGPSNLSSIVERACLVKDHLSSVKRFVWLHACRLAVSSTTALEAARQKPKAQRQPVGHWPPKPHRPPHADCPIPDKLTCCGLPPPLSVTETSALRDPA